MQFGRAVVVKRVGSYVDRAKLRVRRAVQRAGFEEIDLVVRFRSSRCRGTGPDLRRAGAFSLSCGRCVARVLKLREKCVECVGKAPVLFHEAGRAASRLMELSLKCRVLHDENGHFFRSCLRKKARPSCRRARDHESPSMSAAKSGSSRRPSGAEHAGLHSTQR
jgi:hypothetical protein